MIPFPISKPELFLRVITQLLKVLNEEEIFKTMTNIYSEDSLKLFYEI